MANTIVITLTKDTWVSAGGTFDDQRAASISNRDSAQSETYGWDAEVKARTGVAQCVRTSDTVCTIELLASEVAAYRITSNETITVTVPAAALTTSTSAVVATGAFTITAAAESVAVTGTAGGDGALESEITTGGQDVVLTLTNTIWATFSSAVQDALIAGLDSAQSETAGWNNQIRDTIASANAVRTSATVATITILASAATGYKINDNEVITVTVPASALVYGADLAGNQTFTITAELEFIPHVVMF